MNHAKSMRNDHSTTFQDTVHVGVNESVGTIWHNSHANSAQHNKVLLQHDHTALQSSIAILAVFITIYIMTSNEQFMSQIF